MKIRNRITALAIVPATLALSFVGAAPAFAQHPHNIIERHPTMTGMAAGVGTRAALKASAARKKRRGQRLNWAERHPTMTGIGTGLVTRKILKNRAAH